MYSSENAPLSAGTKSSIPLERILFICFPIVETQVGVLGIGTCDPWQPTDEEKTLIRLVTKQAAVILANLEAYHRLKQRLETSRLSGRLLSHELNRCPAAIAEELELLTEGHEGQILPNQSKRLKRVQGYVERHQSLIQTILDATRLDAGTFCANMHIQPIHPVLSEVSSRLVCEAASAGVQLTVDLASELPQHRLDPVLVERVIINLVRNAIQYTSQSPICIKAWTDEGKTIVIVEDQGPGIEPQYREFVFQPWHRGQYSAQIAGSGNNLGLGLYFVRGLMELHGGRAEYDNAYSNGARFHLTFPKLGG